MKLLINNIQINWQGEESHYFFNLKHPRANEFKKRASQVPILKSHIYLYTSGGAKICLLSKSALLYSAHLANQNLKASSKDKWLISLPFFHVGGISILARAFLSRSQYFIQEGTWSPFSFKEQIEQKKITLSSLVPTQVYDLIQSDLKAPSCLRALLVGGDFLSASLYEKGRGLGWPLLPCYGSTETSSHIATAKIDSLRKKSFPEMKLLEGVELVPLQKSAQGFFKIKTQGLLTGYFDLKSKKLYDPKDEKGWFPLEDRLSLEANILKVRDSHFQRRDGIFFQDQIKVLGEKVNLKSLDSKFQKLLNQNKLKVYFIALPEERRGWSLVLIGEIKDFEKLFSVVEQYNKKVSGYEKLQTLYFLDKDLQIQFLKVKRSLLLEKLGFYREIFSEGGQND